LEGRPIRGAIAASVAEKIVRRTSLKDRDDRFACEESAPQEQRDAQPLNRSFEFDQ
jgi:ABC-type arginine transport system ATPase subunit